MNDVVIVEVLEALYQLRDDLLGDFLRQKSFRLPFNKLFEIASVGVLLHQIDPVLTAVRLILLDDVRAVDPTHQLPFSIDAVPAAFGERAITRHIQVIFGYTLDCEVAFYYVFNYVLCLHSNGWRIGFACDM